MKKFLGQTAQLTVQSLHLGDAGVLHKNDCEYLEAEFDGFVGDRHRGHSRTAWAGDRAPAGEKLRNDRQWSAVSIEELALVTEKMNLSSPLQAGTLGANLCFSGMAGFSLLPRGTRLIFPSGAALTVEEYNPPCAEMGATVVKQYQRQDGEPMKATDFLKPASGRRGVVGVIDFPGRIEVGDECRVEIFREPDIRLF